MRTSRAIGVGVSVVAGAGVCVAIVATRLDDRGGLDFGPSYSTPASAVLHTCNPEKIFGIARRIGTQLTIGWEQGSPPAERGPWTAVLREDHPGYSVANCRAYRPPHG